MDFSFPPTEKDEFFPKPLTKSGKDQSVRTHQPLRNDFHSPFRKSCQGGGGGGKRGVYKMEWPITYAQVLVSEFYGILQFPGVSMV